MISTVKPGASPIRKIVIVILLLANGITAMATGYVLTGGSPLKIPNTGINYQNHLPFNHFFLPGIILFLILGTASMMVAIIGLIKKTFYSAIISLQGMALLSWILAQIAYLGFLHPLHLVIGITSVVIILAGIFYKYFKKQIYEVHNSGRGSLRHTKRPTYFYPQCRHDTSSPD